MRLPIAIFLLSAHAAAFANSPASLTLDSALRLARDNNPAIRQAEAQLDEVLGQQLNVRGNRLPSLDLLGSYGRVDDELARLGDSESWNVDLQVSQTIYAGGGIQAANRQVDALVESARAEFESTILLAFLRVRESWYSTLLAKEQIAVREASIKLLEQQLQVIRDRYEAGSVSRFELLRGEVALANGRPALIRARNGYELSIVTLLQAIGLSSADPEALELVGELEYNPIDVEMRASLETARRQRPEFRAVDARIRAAESGVDVADSERLPTLGLVAGYSVQKDPASTAWDDTLDGWQVGLRGAWNLWDGNSKRGNRMAADARLRQAQIGRDDLELQIATEVRQAFLSVKEAQELVDASQKVVEQAREALSLAQDRYAVGAAIQLEVLEAEVALTDARTNEVSALADYNLATARLRAAMGQ